MTPPHPRNVQHAWLVGLDHFHLSRECRQTTQEEIIRTNSALHRYQQVLLDCVAKGRNHIVVAPTGSGKTRIAVETAGILLQRKPGAKVLYLAPTVSLTEQQTGQHVLPLKNLDKQAIFCLTCVRMLILCVQLMQIVVCSQQP